MKRMTILLVLICSILLALPYSIAESKQSSTIQPRPEVLFGQYETDNHPENGNEPIEWIVLTVQDGKALMVSKQVLDCRAFNQSKKDIVWLSSGIREWLNGEFWNNSFTDEEKAAVLKNETSNLAEEGNPEWNPAMGSSTTDRVFLLSYQEVLRFFPEQNDRKVTGTEYARSHGARFAGITTIGIGETDWWLRSPGRALGEATFVNVYGNFDTKSIDTKQGIRPAIWLDLASDDSEFPYIRFTEASQLMKNGNYGDAGEIFEALGSYNNSYSLAQQCFYKHAIQSFVNKDYDTAITLFEKLNGYEDSYERCRAARYEKAVAYQEAKDYAKAIELFGEVGQYRDSMARLKDCFDKHGISMFYFHADPVNTGVDTGYSKAESIQGNDRHFGWRLGRFFLSGFTRVTDNTTNNPIFIKTLGDSVTLWFDLEQDINALYGNTNLIISADTNGYDQFFAVKKTNLGRGALIIRRTDYRNAKADPVIYTDYLLAKGTTGADTKVVLNEEGDYEVALDYELQDNDITHALNKYDNYKIMFRFSVRNGNCMVYPFDVGTKGELQNTAITENGFYLDLARSRYLDIDVKRTVLVDNGSGIVEDERFNRPAKDGDKYTQEGIYTISVKNRYTGESTTKTLFVGSQELLDQYKSMGFSEDRLK